MELLKEDLKKPEEPPKEAPKDEQQQAEARAILCARCRNEITEPRSLFRMRAGSPKQVFPNPYGHMRVILTVRQARGLVLTGAPTTEFTWFSGYAWRIAYCDGCLSHLGWSFERVDPASEPERFFGLLEAALVEV